MKRYSIALSIVGALNCLAMDQQPLLSLNKSHSETRVTMDMLVRNYQPKSAEGKLLQAAHNNYPLRFIAKTDALMYQSQIKDLQQFLPDLKDAVYNPQPSCSKRHAYYMIHATYILLSSAVLTYALTQDPQAAIIISSLLYIGMRIGCMAKTYASYDAHRTSIELEYELLEDYINVQTELARVSNAYQETIESKASLLLGELCIELQKAAQHKKLFSLDGGQSYEVLEQEYTRVKTALLSDVMDDVTTDTSDTAELQAALEDAVKKNDLVAFHTTVRSYAQSNPQLVLSVLEDVKKILRCVCCRPTHESFEWGIKAVVGLPYWAVNYALIAINMQNYAIALGLLPLAVLIGSLDGFGWCLHQGDTIEIDGFKEVARHYKTQLETQLRLKQINNIYQQTLTYQESLPEQTPSLQQKKEHLQKTVAQLQRLLQETRARLA